MLKGDYNLNNANKVTFRYNQLDSNSPVGQSGSSSLGIDPRHRLDELPLVRQLELRDSREPQVGHRRVELGVRQHDEQPPASATRIRTRAADRRARRRCFRSSSSATARHAAHRVRQRAVHAVQSAPLQHVPGAGQRDEVRQEPLDHLRRQRREVPLRQLVLLRHPERLLVQLAGRLLHRREQLPRQSEPHDVAGDAGSSSR